MFIGLFSFLLGALIWGGAIHAIRWAVDREHGHPFSESLYLGLGIKVAAFVTVLLLGGLLGPLVMGPVFFFAWAILARYGKLSEMQAVAAVGLLVAIDLVATVV